MDDARMRHAPAQQPSSTVTTLRALVMLACLVGIPTIALRGKVDPDMIRSYLIQKLGGSIPEPDTRTGLDEAPPFVPPVAGSMETAAGHPSSASALSAASVLQSAHVPSRSMGYQPWNEPLSSSENHFQQSAPSPRIAQPPPTVSQGPAAQAGRRPDAVLANYDSPAGTASGTVPVPPGYRDMGAGAGMRDKTDPAGPVRYPMVGLPSQAAQTAGGPDTVDQFLYVQQRLRDLGADYYLLENWGNQGECYRFHCRISVANSANFTKHFEATDSQPLGAMTRVLADVESWRLGSSAWEPLPAASSTGGQPPSSMSGQASSPHGPYIR